MSVYTRWIFLRRVCFVILVAALLSCTGIEVDHSYETCAVATVSPIATDIALHVFRKGGNAFDAGVAVAFTLAVVHPQAGNIGGGGFAVVRDARTGRIESLDFRETAPAAATTDMFLDSAGNVITNASLQGALAAGVPGTVYGIHELWRRYGSLPWQQLVEYAARLADSGFVVSAQLAADFAEYRAELQKFPETAKIFLRDGQPYAEGDVLVQTELAGVLRMIGAQGPDAFYQGTIADRIDSTMKLHGGLITRDDLAAYKAVWREPAHFTFDSLDIYTMAPPSSGGIIIGQILKLIEPFDFRRYTSKSPEYIHVFAEASKLAFADRATHLGDPAFYQTPQGLVSDEYLDERRKLIDIKHATSSTVVSAGNPNQAVESSQTTHFSICDSSGNMVAISYTLNTSFGSLLVVDGAGFLLNNEMDDFAIKPGVPNVYGLVGSEANKIEPGKRMLSSMSPTLILSHGQPYLALGSPGGSRIITTVAGAIVNISRFGMEIDNAANAPRYHHQWLPDQLALEAGKFDVGTMQSLITLGHEISEQETWSDLHIVQYQSSGLMRAASDYRHGGEAAGF